MKSLYPYAIACVAALPNNSFFNRLRGKFLSYFLASCGKGLRVGSGLIVYKPHLLSVGDNCSFNVRIYINPSRNAPIVFGNEVLVGPNCVFRSANHRFEDATMPIREQGHEGKAITVEDDCWLGAGVIVLPGVTIGRGSVVGAGSVVAKDVAPFSVVAGVPARLIRRREGAS